MALFLLLLCIFTFISRLHGSEEVQVPSSSSSSSSSNMLAIEPAPLPGIGQLVFRTDDVLNLTCSVTSGNSSHMNKFKITWTMPYSSKNSQQRVSSVQNHNKLTLVLSNLQESDSGDYKCQAIDENQTSYLEVVRVTIKRKKMTNCNENMFPCTLPPGTCIAQRYVCDGVRDCPEGSDESPVHCGLNACEGKLRCENGRCIPYEWCCDDYVDPNCTVKVRLPCCHKLVTGDMDADGYPPSEQQRFNDMGFLQTTIYTVIGCAMAFMFIVTVLVIAICRVHMKRSGLSRCPGDMLGSHGGPGGSLSSQFGGGRMLSLSRGSVPPLYDLDVFLSRSGDLSQQAHSGLLVTYNINNGVQFVGRPVEPPPYCEIVATPPREGPPPPYTSRENLAPAIVDHEESEENPGEGDRLLGNAHRNNSPVIRTGSSTIQAMLENPGEGDSLLSNVQRSGSPVVMPSYVNSIQIAVVNPLPLYSSNEGATESELSSSETTDHSPIEGSLSSDLSDHQTGNTSESSAGQLLPSSTSTGDCTPESTDNTPCIESVTGMLDSTNSEASHCSCSVSADIPCEHGNVSISHENAKLQKASPDASLNSISRPVDASLSLTSTPNTDKISARENVCESLGDSFKIDCFATCEGSGLNVVAESSKATA